MSAKTMVITGASDGIGRAAAKAFRRQGHTVVIVGRNPEKTASVAREIGAEHHIADFARLDDVHSLAVELLQRHSRIDVLANNAGGIMGKRATTVDGHELSLQVNHLAPFLLTALLMPRLLDSRATVIATSSLAARIARLDIDDLETERRYSAVRAYSSAKLANAVFARELQRRFGSRGLCAASFEPGSVATNFAVGASGLVRVLHHSPLKHLLLTAERAADTLVWLATQEPGKDWTLGGHFYKRRPVAMSASAVSGTVAGDVWARSVKLLGDRWPTGLA